MQIMQPSLDPKNKNLSFSYFYGFIVKNHKDILKAINDKEDIMEGADIDINGEINIDDTDYAFDYLNDEEDIKNLYLSGHTCSITKPNPDDCRGIMISNVPQEIWDNMGSGFYFKPVPGYKHLYWMFEWC